MENIPSLVELFDDMDKEGLVVATLEIGASKLPVPLAEIAEILEETIDLEIVAALVELLIFRFDDVVDDIMSIEYNKASTVVKNHFVMVLAFAERSKTMQFLLDEYFYNPYMRPMIRKHAFKNKKFLFMNLVRFYEDLTFNRDNVEIAQQILKIIPRDVILSTTGLFMGTKLLDVYYAIPVDQREKLDS